MKFVFMTFLVSYGAGVMVDGVASTPDTSRFELVKKADGISLYERWYEIKPNQYAREVKATFTVKAPAHAALALIRNESKGTRWNRHTRSYRIVGGNADVWFGYIEYDLPWPVSNQDCVLHFQRIRSEDDDLHVEFKGTTHPSFPIQKRIQRIAEISGRWIFNENNGVIDVEYYITTTPSPTLPAWLTDPIIRDNLLETLGGFREILEMPRLAVDE